MLKRLVSLLSGLGEPDIVGTVEPVTMLLDGFFPDPGKGTAAPGGGDPDTEPADIGGPKPSALELAELWDVVLIRRRVALAL
jgi:hypothetical protein